MAIFRRRQLLTGASNVRSWTMKKIAIFDQYFASSRVLNAATVRCYKHIADDRGKLVKLIAGVAESGRVS